MKKPTKQKPKKRKKTEEEEIQRMIDRDCAFWGAMIDKAIPAIKDVYKDLTTRKPSPAEAKASESKKGTNTFLERWRG
jgi:hypothetical protein